MDLQAGDIGEVRGIAGEHGEVVCDCGGGDERIECSRPVGAPGCSQCSGDLTEAACARIVEGQRIEGRLGHLEHELAALPLLRIGCDQ